MGDRRQGKGARRGIPYGAVYESLLAWFHQSRGAPLAAEAGPAEPARPEFVRFFKRLGAVPRSWPSKKAEAAAGEAIARMAAAAGADVGVVRSVLLEFCTGQAGAAPCGPVPACGDCPVAPYCAEPGRRPTIKDLPDGQRPRERLFSDGEEALSDVELLAIILRDGAQGATALDLAGRLLSAFGDFRRLADCTVSELTRVKGIGPAKAAQVKAALAIARRYASGRLAPGTQVTGSRQLFEHMRERLAGLKKERFYTLMLDTKHRIIAEETVAIGSLNESVVHPREVFKNAIRQSAAKVIFIHNHPSGVPDPSPQDRRLTARLCQAGAIVGIEVLDHLIIGRDGYFSFAEHGLLTGAGAGPAGA